MNTKKVLFIRIPRHGIMEQKPESHPPESVYQSTDMAAMEPTAAEIRQAQRGSVSAFEKIVTFYSISIYNLAFRFIYDRDEARDLAQEVFLRLYTNLRQYDPTRPFRPWLYRLAANTCINATRGRRRRPSPGDPEILEQRQGGSRDADPACAVAARDSAAALQQAVAELPEDYRAVVVLRYIEDMSCEDVAKALDLPTGTVKTWLYRGREILRRRLKEEG
jgi:RNA polymerase sigma-70 factor (ECF subfamily)